MQEAADWLDKLGLGQYAQRFAENGIDFSVLCYLTDQDLKELGVSLGHRRKMLAVDFAIPPSCFAAAAMIIARLLCLGDARSGSRGLQSSPGTSTAGRCAPGFDFGRWASLPRR